MQDFYTIDSGKAGAIIYFKDGEPVQYYQIPYDDTGDFIDIEPLINTLEALPVFIEKIVPFTPNAYTVAKQFQSYGALVSACTYTSENDFHFIPVATWQAFGKKVLKMKPKSKWTKNDGRALASKYWPEFCEKIKKRVIPDGAADAMCLGAYVLALNIK